MKIALALLLVVVVCGQSYPDSDPSDCLYYHVPTKGTFDLTPLKLAPTSAYTVQDKFDFAARNYTYYFNICNAVQQPSDKCIKSGLDNTNVPAYQVVSADGRCWRLGDGYNDSTWNLLDVQDPSRGVSLTYVGGEKCGATNATRELMIVFKCADKYSVQADSRVEETSPCHYYITFENVFGCPLECPIANRRLCGGHGTCGFDSAIGKPRCFCDQSHAGDDCTKDAASVAPPSSSSSSCDGLCVALSIAVTLLSILLVISIVIYARVAKLEWNNVRLTNQENPYGPAPVSDRTTETVN